MKSGRILFLSILLTFPLLADIPGGQLQTAQSMGTNIYEMVLSPSYLMSQGGAYLTSEMRYHPSEDLGVGFAFGAGEVGFNFGLNGTWFIVPDLNSQPAVALVGGVYFNRLNQANYFSLKLAPTVSKTFRMGWGGVTPYASLPMSPSFSLSGRDNEFGMKVAIGSELVILALNDIHLWWEFDVALMKSSHEIVFGLSYPFNALGS